MNTSQALMLNALKHGKVIPSFNVSYLPMVAPILRACRDANSLGQIAVARADWVTFGVGNLKAAAEVFRINEPPEFVTLHLDHVPVVEEGEDVPYEDIIGEAIEAGYGSVMVDASMLTFEENIAATRRITEMAHAANVPVEAEIGAVVGYNGIPMPYEELFASRMGFTDIDQAQRLVRETGADWLSVAVGNVHGALTAQRSREKISARLDIEHLRRIYAAVNVPLVLHGGSGIPKPYIAEAVCNGIAKINIATAVRQPYEAHGERSVEAAQQAVYEAALRVLTEDLSMRGSAEIVGLTGG